MHYVCANCGEDATPQGCPKCGGPTFDVDTVEGRRLARAYLTLGPKEEIPQGGGEANNLMPIPPPKPGLMEQPPWWLVMLILVIVIASVFAVKLMDWSVVLTARKVHVFLIALAVAGVRFLLARKDDDKEARLRRLLYGPPKHPISSAWFWIYILSLLLALLSLVVPPFEGAQGMPPIIAMAIASLVSNIDMGVWVAFIGIFIPLIGDPLERRIGTPYFLAIFLGAGILGSVVHVLMQATGLGPGLAGGAMGVLGASLALLVGLKPQGDEALAAWRRRAIRRTVILVIASHGMLLWWHRPDTDNFAFIPWQAGLMGLIVGLAGGGIRVPRLRALGIEGKTAEPLSEELGK